MSLWLVRIALDLRNRDVRHDLRDITAVHQRVMSLVPDGLGHSARQQAGVLFRLDQTRTGPVMLVQTALPPGIDSLPAGYGVVDTRDLSPLIDALHDGMAVHYRIAGNASKRTAIGANAGKILALSGLAADQWWQHQARTHGLDLLSLHADPQPPAQGRAKPVRHAITRFDGRAIIRDADMVRAAVRDGIGRGKSFGCGLLSLAPAR